MSAFIESITHDSATIDSLYGEHKIQMQLDVPQHFNFIRLHASENEIRDKILKYNRM